MNFKIEMAEREQFPITPVGAMTDGELKSEAVMLKLAIEQGEQRTREWRIRLGEVLTELRKREGHGNWLPYVKENLPIEEAQARNYMLLAAKRQRVIDLPTGLSMREELAALREPRPLPDNGTHEVEEGPVTRYLIDISTAEVVANILHVCFPQAKDALDVTYGSGNFWNGERSVEVTAHDLDPARALHGEMDFRDLKYGDKSFDVVLFDPPHMADTGEDSILGERFGSYSNDELKDVVQQGAREAWRVSNLGVVIKVADTVHNQVFVSMTTWVYEALADRNPYEIVHQVRSHPFVDPKWLKPQLSAINNGSTYMIFRHGKQQHARTK
jgi:hypothetical protein